MKIGILGYGNLGRGVEFAVKENSDMELAAVFTRRNPDSVKILSENVPVVHVDDVKNWTGKIEFFAAEVRPICRHRLRNLRKCLTLSTALTLMQKSPNILQKLMRRRKVQVTLQ